MAKASFYWGSFLGGEISPTAQGKLDDPRYGTAMNLCYNALIEETGTWRRRPNWQFVGTTHYGRAGKLLSMPYQNGGRALLELTSDEISTGNLRLWVPPYHTLGGALLGDFPYVLYCDAFDTVTNFDTAAPAEITTNATHTWATGDTVILFNANGGTIACRQFFVTRVDSTHFELNDPISGFGIDGTLPEFGAGVSYVGHVKDFATQYTDFETIKAVRIAATDGMAFTLHRTVNPLLLTVEFDDGAPTFTYAAAGVQQLDGPFLDALPGLSQTDNSIATVSANGGNWNFTISDSAYSFVADDATAARAIRVWNQPPAWASGTSYSLGDQVSYNGNFWKLGKTGVTAGTAPGQSYTSAGVPYAPWVLAPEAGYWAYGDIISITSSTTAVVALNTAPNVNGSAIDTWQLGAYTVDQWPTCGCWADGRLWLAGAVPNRIDSTISGITNHNFPGSEGAVAMPAFAPTDKHGVVLDSSAISYTMNSEAPNDIYWMADDQQGVLVGTSGGEWVIHAAGDDPLTPFSTKIKKSTKYQCSNIEPIRTGPALVFTQGFIHKVYEYLADSFTNRFSGRQLNGDVLHLFGDGIAELAYQEEAQPTLWARTLGGSLRSCTYRRVSRWATEPPAAFAWSQHAHGAGALCDSIVTAARGTGVPQYPTVAGIFTDDSVEAGTRYVEVLAPINDIANEGMLTAFYTDVTRGGKHNVFASDAISGGGPGPDGGTSLHGKFYQEFTVNTISSGSSGGQPMGVGVAGYNQTRATGFTLPRTGNPGVGAQECVVFAHNGDVWTSNAHTSSGAATYSAGNRVAIRCDTINQTIAFRNVTTNSAWSSDYTISGIDTTAGIFVFFCGTGFSGTDDVTLIAPGSESGTIPATFEAWGTIVWSSAVQSYAYSTASLNATFSAVGLRAAIGPGVTTGAPSNIPSPNSVGTNYFNVGIPRVGAPPNDDAWQCGYIGILATGGKASP